MVNNDVLKAIAAGMKGNADALLAFFCLIACGTFLTFGLHEAISIGAPLTIFGLYVFLRLRQKKFEVTLKEIDFDREKESNRVILERKKRKALK